MKNRKQQNYKLGEMKTNYCIEITVPRQKEKKKYTNISCFCQVSAKFVELEPALLIILL